MTLPQRSVAACLLALCATPAASAQSSAQGQVVSQLVFENEYVRIERVTIPVGYRSAIHTHAHPSVEVFLTDDHVRETLADGATREFHSKAGDVAWNDAVTHRVENLSRESVVLIAIGIKGRPAATGQNPSGPATGAANVEIENDWVRVVRGRIPAKAKGQLHSHPRYVGIFLSDTKLRATLADGSTREITGKRGDASWREPVTHQIENLADTPFEAIDVNLKTLVGTPSPSPHAALRRVPAAVSRIS